MITCTFTEHYNAPSVGIVKLIRKNYHDRTYIICSDCFIMRMIERKFSLKEDDRYAGLVLDKTLTNLYNILLIHKT